MNNNPDSIYPPEVELPDSLSAACAEIILKAECDHSMTVENPVSGTIRCATCNLLLKVKALDIDVPNAEPRTTHAVAMKQYVVGFLFSPDFANVVLIEKNTEGKEGQEWQHGLHNGVGGSVEYGETRIDAMRREFKEETGMEVEDWREFCTIEWRGSEITFFTGIGDVAQAMTVTKEIVRHVPVEYFNGYKIIPHLRWLIPMAMDMNVGSAIVEYLL